MNKSELVSAMAAASGRSREDSKLALESMVSAIGEALKKGERVSLLGFGTLEAVDRKARTGVNPSSKQKIEIPAKTTVKFRPGADLLAKLNG